MLSLFFTEIIWQIRHGLVTVYRLNHPLTRMDAGFHGLFAMPEKLPISIGF
ncbi:hypothetical protein BLL52_1582 [Rhodoferax antarcticus ANT.BR]|uniref:Uncharacterized protein n=1 Tax=Rhodoferax antarcticus ANT.BR TaxID=1111071 RepID=A0A1Q8YFN5_9BURK|nr:hypothetical protein BLL52_1582 [Rhodoferax antarcticus ANT.BR]